MVLKLAKISPFAHELRSRYLYRPKILEHLELFLAFANHINALENSKTCTMSYPKYIERYHRVDLYE